MSGLGALVNKLNKYAEVPDRVKHKAKDTLKDLLLAQFRRGTDPYGRPWKKTKKGNASFLYKTGKLMSSMDVKVEGDQIVMTGDFPTHVHQMTRPIFTIGVMPQSWSQAIHQSFEEEMKRV